MDDQLLEKLKISKAIMERHQGIARGSVSQSLPSISEENITAKYNIQDIDSITESIKPQQITVDKIKNSKLPDAIKQLMIEHPIDQIPNNKTILSEDLVNKASRLMNTKKPESQKLNGVSDVDIKKIVKETVQEVLRENGLLLEGNEKTNELFSFKVGKHIFEGKITKIKKVI